MSTKSTTADSARVGGARTLTLVCLLAWVVPGAAHVALGRRQKGAVFLVVLSLMFVIGLTLHGASSALISPSRWSRSRRSADVGLGGPWMLARAVGAGAGQVTATTYEYGNTFLIVAGLLNFLVILDAFDIAKGRK